MEGERYPERYELKYYIDGDLWARVRAMVAPYVEYDAYSLKAPENRYLIRSVYLDNDLWDSYYHNLDGLKIRRKYRVRSYTRDEGRHFLEIKKKIDSTVVKRRRAVSSDTLDLLIGGDAEPGEYADGFMSSFSYAVTTMGLRPQVLIEYDREAYVGIEGERVRITVDRRVRSAPCPTLRFSPQPIPWCELLPEDRAILELKFDGAMPRFLREMVRGLNLMHEPISKYCIGVRACNLV